MNASRATARPASRPRSRAAGFTLLEMIVVLVIIGLIMGLVGPRLFGQADKAKVQAAGTQIKMLGGALQTLRLDVGRFPTAAEGLGLLVRAPAGESVRGWAGPYLDEDVPLAEPVPVRAGTLGKPCVHAFFIRRRRQAGRGRDRCRHRPRTRHLSSRATPCWR